MATGQSEAVRAGPDSLGEALTAAEFVTVLAQPTATQVIAAAALAVASPTPVQVRVLCEGDCPAVLGDFVIGTAPTISCADRTLSHRPLVDVRSLEVDGPSPVATLLTSDDVPAGEPGLVAVSDDIATSLAHSARVYGPFAGQSVESVRERLDGAGMPRTISELQADPTVARELASWLVATLVESHDRPASVRAGIESSLTPQYLSDAPAPTREGLEDMLAVVTPTAPGLALAALADESYIAALRECYLERMPDIYEVVASAPVDTNGQVATLETEDGAIETIAWLWGAYRLQAPYALVCAANSDRIALASTGPRSASALLEEVVTGHDAVGWGSETVAGARVALSETELVRTIEERL